MADQVVQFQSGDIVRLKSGGPKMTVVFNYKETVDYLCVWWVDASSEYAEKRFKAETLSKVGAGGGGPIMA